MRTEPISVLHVLDMLSYGSGVASVVMGWLRHLDPERVRMDIAVHKPCDMALESEAASCGARVFHLSDIRLPSGGEFHREFVSLLRENEYPIIHGHVANSAFIYMREAKKQGIPHRILHAHNPYGADTLPKRIRNRILDSGIHRWANQFFACSVPSARYLFRKRAERALILPNAIDPDRFCYTPHIRRAVRDEWKLREDQICIGHIGRFTPQKNHFFLLEAFRLYHAVNPDSRLILVGDGLLEAEIRARIERDGLSDAVILAGRRSDPERLYQAFDMFWLPSKFEGWGLVAVEAQCAGLPCILSEAVPQEVDCTRHICRLPIEDSKPWAEESAAMLKGFVRTDGSAAVREKGLDVRAQAAMLENLYTDMQSKSTGS